MPNRTAIRDALLGVIQTYGKDFLDRHEDAKAFVADRVERVANLAFQYAVIPDETVRVEIEQSMEIAKQAAENELAGVALDASAEAKAEFARVLGVAFESVIKLVPKVLGL